MWLRSRTFLNSLPYRLKLLNKNYMYNFSSKLQTLGRDSNFKFIHILNTKTSDKLCSVFDCRNMLSRSYSESGSSSSEVNSSAHDTVKVYFVLPNDEEVEVIAKVGDTVMELAVDAIDMEAACNGQRACTTCHVYVDERFEEHFEEPEEEEEDLLDSAPFQKTNSRLGCCLTITKEMDGIRFSLPTGTRNFYVDGKRPAKHH